MGSSLAGFWATACRLICSGVGQPSAPQRLVVRQQRRVQRQLADALEPEALVHDLEHRVVLRLRYRARDQLGGQRPQVVALVPPVLGYLGPALQDADHVGRHPDGGPERDPHLLLPLGHGTELGDDRSRVTVVSLPMMWLNWLRYRFRRVK
jgi:hypothetical protein